LSSRKIVVTPSKLHQFTFCSRQTWFDHYIGLKKPLKMRIRMFIGRILHYIHHLFKIGYEKERLLGVDIPDLNVLLVGKPDSYKVSDDVIYVEEFKSTRSPKGLNRFGLGIWESDFIQTLSYAYILYKLYRKPVIATVRYIDTAITFQYDDKMEAYLLWYIDQYRKMVETGVLPDVYRGKRCSSCIYKEICDIIDSETESVINSASNILNR